MKSFIAASCLGLSLSMSAFAASENFCEYEGEDKVPDTVVYAGAVIINNQPAKALYESMSHAPIYSQFPARGGGVAVQRRIGNPFVCYKQVYEDCVSYTCNVGLL